MCMQEVGYSEEIRIIYRVLLTVDRVLARYSPVILLQRHIRGWLVRKALAKSTNQKIRYSPLENDMTMC